MMRTGSTRTEFGALSVKASVGSTHLAVAVAVHESAIAGSGETSRFVEAILGERSTCSNTVTVHRLSGSTVVADVPAARDATTGQARLDELRALIAPDGWQPATQTALGELQRLKSPTLVIWGRNEFPRRPRSRASGCRRHPQLAAGTDRRRTWALARSSRHRREAGRRVHDDPLTNPPRGLQRALGRRCLRGSRSRSRDRISELWRSVCARMCFPELRFWYPTACAPAAMCGPAPIPRRPYPRLRASGQCAGVVILGGRVDGRATRRRDGPGLSATGFRGVPGSRRPRLPSRGRGGPRRLSA